MPALPLGRTHSGGARAHTQARVRAANTHTRTCRHSHNGGCNHNVQHHHEPHQPRHAVQHHTPPSSLPRHGTHGPWRRLQPQSSTAPQSIVVTTAARVGAGAQPPPLRALGQAGRLPRHECVMCWFATPCAPSLLSGGRAAVGRCGSAHDLCGAPHAPRTRGPTTSAPSSRCAMQCISCVRGLRAPPAYAR